MYNVGDVLVYIGNESGGKFETGKRYIVEKIDKIDYAIDDGDVDNFGRAFIIFENCSQGVFIDSMNGDFRDIKKHREDKINTLLK